MAKINLNYKDVQFILGCSIADAKHVIYKHLAWEEKKEIEPEDIKFYHTVPSDAISIKMNSFSDALHGKPQIQTIIDQMQEKGISDKMKHEVLEDVKNMVRGGLYGKWATLKRILTKEQITELEESLAVRRRYFISGGNKIPKNLLKYASE